jgi:heat shock protein HtpX
MKNQLKTVVLLGALSALVVGVGGAIAPQSLSLFVLLALAMNVGAYFFSDRLVLAMNRAQELSPLQAPALHDMVEALAARAGIPKPRVFLIADQQPNAFATGRNPRHGVVAVTAGILDLLSPRQLQAVLAHEIAHIKNRDILLSSIAAALASLITYAAQALSFGFLFGRGDADGDGEQDSAAGGILVALVAPLAATLIQLGISRSREYLADETGAALTGDPDALADALVRLHHGVADAPGTQAPATASLFIVNPLAGERTRAVLGLFSTHPAIEDRVRRLRAMAPAGPRRAPRVRRLAF